MICQYLIIGMWLHVCGCWWRIVAMVNCVQIEIYVTHNNDKLGDFMEISMIDAEY